MFKIEKSESGFGLTQLKAKQKCNKARLHKIWNTSAMKQKILHKINAMKQYYGLSQLMLLWFECVSQNTKCVCIKMCEQSCRIFSSSSNGLSHSQNWNNFLRARLHKYEDGRLKDKTSYIIFEPLHLILHSYSTILIYYSI